MADLPLQESDYAEMGPFSPAMQEAVMWFLDDLAAGPLAMVSPEVVDHARLLRRQIDADQEIGR